MSALIEYIFISMDTNIDSKPSTFDISLSSAKQEATDDEMI